MVYNFLGIDEKTEKSTYILSEYPYSNIRAVYPCDYPPCYINNMKSHFIKVNKTPK